MKSLSVKLLVFVLFCSLTSTLFASAGLVEFALVAQHWLSDDCPIGSDCSAADWYVDGAVDIYDIRQLAINWLEDEVAITHKVILVTGYWPPTNEMLRPFSTNPTQNPDGWQGRNFNNSGYDVYAYFPEFPNGTGPDPKGQGDFEVDYQDTYADFVRITNLLRPSVVLSYGNGAGPWEIEYNAPWPNNWVSDFLDPKKPDQPTAETCPPNLTATLPVEDIKAAVIADLPGMNAWIDYQADPGNFLCHYMALLGMKYQTENDHCEAAGFIHVSGGVTVDDAKTANLATLRAITDWKNNE